MTYDYSYFSIHYLTALLSTDFYFILLLAGNSSSFMTAFSSNELSFLYCILLTALCNPVIFCQSFFRLSSTSSDAMAVLKNYPHLVSTAQDVLHSTSQWLVHEHKLPGKLCSTWRECSLTHCSIHSFHDRAPHQ